MKTQGRTGIILAAALLCLAAGLVRAADYASVRSGDWNDPGTWGSAEYPVAGDNVTINDGHTVTITAAAAAATVEVRAGGELAETGTSTLVLSGSLTNHGSITRSRLAAWTVGQAAGNFANHGRYTHNNSGDLTVANGNFVHSGEWTSTNSGAAINVPNGSFAFTADMTHAGPITVGVGNFAVPAGVSFDRGGGTGALTVSAGDFVTAGEWTSTGTSAINTPNGTLVLQADMVHAGAITVGLGGFTIPAGRTLNRVGGGGLITVANGDFTNLGTCLHTGSGNFTVSEGDFIQSGDWNSLAGGAVISIPEGRFILEADMRHEGPITVGVGGLTIPAGLTLNRGASTALITVSAGDFVNNGTFLHTGSGNITVSAGDFINNSIWSSTGSGSVITLPVGAFTMNADMEHDAVSLGTGDFVIPAGRTLDRGAGGGVITVSVGDFVNNGTYLHTGSGNITVSDGDLVQSGAWTSTASGATISLPRGTIRLEADMSHGGPITIGIGGFTIPTGRTYTHSNSGAVNITGGLTVVGTLRRTGSGVFTIATGDFLNNGEYANTTTGDLNVSTGVFINAADWSSTNGSAAINVPNGTFAFTADMTHAGAITVGLGGLTIPAGLTLNRLGGSGQITLPTGDFTNLGQYGHTGTGNISLTTGNFRHAGEWTSTGGSAAIIVPEGRFTLETDINHGGPITVGFGGLVIPDTVTYNHTGTGAVNITGGLTINGTLNRTGSGIFTVATGDFINNGSYSNTSTGDLLITEGSFINSATGEITTGTSTSQNHTIGGSFINAQDDSTRFRFQPKGTVTFTGPAATQVGSASPLVFRNLAVNKPAGSLTMTSELNVEGSLTVLAGSFALGGERLTIGRSTAAGSITVQPGGRFDAVGAGDEDGGTVTAFAPAANRAYGFTVNGTIAARNARFERMNANGIRLTETGTVAPGPDNFSGCTFDYGASDAPMLWVDRDLDADLEIVGARFDDGNPDAKNIKKTAGGTGRVIVSERAGALWGEPFELDPDGPNPDGLIDWVQRDVGVTRLVAPVGRLDSGTVVIPAAVVRNFGTVPAEFPAYFTIGAFYSDSARVTLAAGASDTVRFAAWTAVQVGRHEAACRTALEGDMNPGNDRLADTVEVTEPVWDAGVTRLVAPVGRLDSGVVVTPTAVVRNFGTHIATFPVHFTVGGFYTDSVRVTLAAGASDTVRFADWTAEQVGRHEAACRTALEGDMNPANDRLADTVEVARPVRDAGVIAILAPVGQVDSGAVITPTAVVRNFGTHDATFPVAFRIGDEYHDTLEVSLGPGSQDTLLFTAWTAAEVGLFSVVCTTMLTGDENPDNNRLADSVRVVPPHGVEEGEPLPIEFAVSRLAPNPLVRTGAVRLALPIAERVKARLYDAAGRQVLVLADGPLPAGRHELRVDTARLAEGVYLLKVEAGEFNSTQKLIVQR